MHVSLPQGHRYTVIRFIRANTMPVAPTAT